MKSVPYTRLPKHKYPSTAQKQLEPFFLRKKSIQIKIVLFAKKTSGSELLKSSELNQFQKAGEFPVKKDIFI